ncbi:MAG TPA: alpha/beta hydrolase [Bryobacteraceae bacterium]|nr:alpha/beta hydrolase [Bryobacteraceae bacterium]
MSTTHFWFRSGTWSLLAHLDTVADRRAPLGLVIVPPFGWEEVCAYRPLRFMAQRFAELGIPTLRYDLPASGDSSGDPQDPGLFDAWVRSVGDAVETLRAAAAVDDVAVLGVHLGAMLAMTASARGANIRQLVLWGPAARGRSLIRELHAAANVERWECLSEDDAPRQPIPGFGASGFLLAPETLKALEELDVAALPWRGKNMPVLLLSRDALPHDPAIVKTLDPSSPDTAIADGAGYADMMAGPLEAIYSPETTQTIAGFLLRRTGSAVRNNAAPVFPEHRHPTESVFQVGAEGSSMFGILTEPPAGAHRTTHGLLFLNAGGVRHTGPNRMWVESARRWAAVGVPSLRLDLPGIGESEGPESLDVPALYREFLIEQIASAIDTLRRTAGMKRFTVIGLCSGACWGFHAAVRFPGVQSAILVNPSLLYWDPEVDRRRILPRFGDGFGGWSDWMKMAATGLRRGGIGRVTHRIAETLRRTNSDAYIQLGFRNFEQAWAAFERARKRVTLVFREGEPLLAEMETAGQLPSADGRWARCIRVPNTGHTFRPLWAQKMLHDLIDRELAETIRVSPEPSVLSLISDSAVSPSQSHSS